MSTYFLEKKMSPIEEAESLPIERQRDVYRLTASYLANVIAELIADPELYAKFHEAYEQDQVTRRAHAH